MMEDGDRNGGLDNIISIIISMNYLCHVIDVVREFCVT